MHIYINSNALNINLVCMYLLYVPHVPFQNVALLNMGYPLQIYLLDKVSNGTFVLDNFHFTAPLYRILAMESYDNRE